MPRTVPPRKPTELVMSAAVQSCVIMRIYVPAVAVPETRPRAGKLQGAKPAVFQGSLRQLGRGGSQDVGST